MPWLVVARMWYKFVRLWAGLRSGRGQSVVEYVLILALVVLVVIVVLTLMGGTTANMMGTMGNTLGNTT